MKKALLFLFLFTSTISLTAQNAQNAAEQEIKTLMNSQIGSWNMGNLDEFMKGYWNDDSLMFVGKSGVTYGYQNILNNYKKYYPDTTAMGKLSFELLHVNQLSPDYYFVVGKFFLKRTIGDAQGHYTLIFRRIKGKWLIVSDHSS